MHVRDPVTVVQTVDLDFHLARINADGYTILEDAIQPELVTRLRGQLDALQRKYEQAMGNRDTLIARHRRAQAQQQVTNSLQSLSTTDYTNDLARMERRIRGEESTSAANAELTASEDTSAYDDLDQQALDAQLAALKQRLGAGSSPAPSGGSSETQKM